MTGVRDKLVSDPYERDEKIIGKKKPDHF